VLSVGTFGNGSAEILASAKSKVNCNAWLCGGTNGMTRLSVVNKDKQRGD
jgi:hypothetical protein